MTPHRHAFKYTFLFIAAAVLLLILGVTLFALFIYKVTENSQGKSQGRTPAAAQFVPSRGKPAPTPTSIPHVIFTATPTPPVATASPSVPDAFRGLLTNGSRDEYKVALTFDLCQTAEALPGIIQSLRQQGYTPVTVSELLQLQPYK